MEKVVKQIVKCPSCGSIFKKPLELVIGENEKSAILDTKCKYCCKNIYLKISRK